MLTTHKKLITQIVCFGFFCALIFAGSINVSHGATVTWVAASNANWNTSSSWSTGKVPTALDIAKFSTTSTNATINGNISVLGITIASTYHGTITQSSSYTILVGTSGYTQASGTFIGGTGTFTINGGNFSLTGGSFTATTGLMSQVAKATNATWVHSGGTFLANGGSVDFAGGITNAGVLVTGSSTFNTLYFDMLLGGTFIAKVATGTTVLSTTNLIIGGTGGSSAEVNLEGGTIAVSGNMSSLNTSFNTGGGTTPATILINGTGAQGIGGSTSTPSVGAFPGITINKTSGTLTFVGYVGVSGDWNYKAGTLAFGTATVDFLGSLDSDPSATGFTISIAGSSTFNNLMFDETGGRPLTVMIAATTTLTVSGTLTIAGTQPVFGNVALQGGTIVATGNLISTNTSPGTGGSNNDPTVILINGTGPQTVTGPAAASEGGFPAFTINKSLGTLTFQNYVTITGNWKYQAGTLAFGTSTITFSGTYYDDPAGNGMTFLLSGSTTFYNLVIDEEGSSRYSLFQVATDTTVLTVNGDFTLAGSGGSNSEADIENGPIKILGNITSTNTDPLTSISDPSVGSLSLNGTSTQIITGSGILGTGSFPSLIINKNSGVAYASSTVDVINLTVTKGELRLGPPVSSMYFEINGNTTVSSGGILSDFALAQGTINFGGSVSNSGIIDFDGSNASCGSIDTILLRTVGGAGVQESWSGSGTFTIRDVDVADQGGTANITVTNGTKTGTDVGSNWSFVVGGQALLLQTATSTGGSGTSQVTLPFGAMTRPSDFIIVTESTRNQTPTTPTDSASDTYLLLTSSTFGSSPSYGLAMYYAKNIVSTSSLVITANGTSSLGGQFLSASAFEYTGVAPSSAVDGFNSNVDISGNAVSLTSRSVAGQYSYELFFGASTIGGLATLSPGTGWGDSTALTNNSTMQALYGEDMDSTSTITASATWSSNASTSYAAILGVFRSPALIGYVASGTVDSETFDTGVASGTQLNSAAWQGTSPNGATVGIQFAVSNSSSGPWTFYGPDGTGNTYFFGNSGVSIPIISTQSGNAGYTLFNGYRYFRYRLTLFASGGLAYSPTVTGVTINWSP